MTAQAGPGLLVTDRLRASGVRVPALATATRERIGELLPPLTYQRNPVDTARPDERFGEVVAAVQSDPGIDAVLVYALYEPGALDPAEVLAAAGADLSTPLLLVTGGPPEEVERLRATVEAGGVPVLTAPERGAAAMRALVADARAAHRRRSGPPLALAGGAGAPRDAGGHRGGPLDEDQAKRLLERAGLRAQLDVNPLRATAAGLVAADALVVVDPTRTLDPSTTP